MKTASEVRRILVALDDSAPSQAALDAAASLAERLGADLEGLFVQDLDLLRLAQLPLAREVGLTSASRRALELPDVERAWRSQAARLKTALDVVAARHRLRTSLRIARGDVTVELLRAATDADVLAMGTMGHMAVTGRRIGSTVRGVATQASCSVLLLRAAPAGHRIVVQCGDSDAAQRALSWAEHLARSQKTGLLVLLAEVVDEETRRRVQEELESVADAQIETIPRAVMAERLAESDCQLLIVPHDSPLLADGDELLGDLAVPVLVVR
jgi:nucleotide-binding universal stress UspA family protein